MAASNTTDTYTMSVEGAQAGIEPGDVICVGIDNGEGHMVRVQSVDGSRVTVVPVNAISFARHIGPFVNPGSQIPDVMRCRRKIWL